MATKTKKEETVEPSAPAQLEGLSVETGDASAVLTVNGEQFALTATDVYLAKRAFELAYFELH